jgi:hypothetical protein
MDRLVDALYFFETAYIKQFDPTPSLLSGGTDVLGVVAMLMTYHRARKKYNKTRSLDTLLWVYMVVLGLVYGVCAWVFTIIWPEWQMWADGE